MRGLSNIHSSTDWLSNSDPSLVLGLANLICRHIAFVCHIFHIQLRRSMLFQTKSHHTKSLSGARADNSVL